MTDQSLIGFEFPAFRFLVEEGKLMEFGRAIHAEDPIYFNREAASAAGFAALPAPPTFSCVTAHWQPTDDNNPLKLDLRRVLAGGNEWEYRRPMMAGEEYTVRSRISDVSQKNGSKGVMTLIVREMSFYDTAGALALIARSTIIQLPPPAPLNPSEVLPT